METAFVLDLHVHTRRYSSCSRLDPEDLALLRRNRGLSGLAVTEHECLWPEAEWAELRKAAEGLFLARGIELAFPECEVLLYGVDEGILSQGAEGLGELLELVDSVAGAAVLAHPFRFGLSEERVRELLGDFRFHGVEVLNGAESMVSNQMAEEVRSALALASVAGSDAHVLSKVGWYATAFEERISDDQALARAIREGRCRATKMD